MSPLELFLRKVSVKGLAREWRFNPIWTACITVEDEEFGVQRLSLVSRGEWSRRAFPWARREGALRPRLSAALAEARRGASTILCRRITDHAEPGAGFGCGALHAGLGCGHDYSAKRHLPCCTPHRLSRPRPSPISRTDGPAPIMTAFAPRSPSSPSAGATSPRWTRSPPMSAFRPRICTMCFGAGRGSRPRLSCRPITLDHAARSAARFRQRARHRLRGRAFRPGAPARSVRHPRGDDARRLEDGGRGAGACAVASTPRLSARHRGGRRRAGWPGSASSTTATARPRSPTCGGAGRTRSFVEDEAATAPLARARLRSGALARRAPLRVVLIGSDFEVRVWETLLRIPLRRARPPIPTSPATSAGRRRPARWARPWGATRSPSWCPATGCSAAPAR